MVQVAFAVEGLSALRMRVVRVQSGALCKTRTSREAAPVLGVRFTSERREYPAQARSKHPEAVCTRLERGGSALRRFNCGLHRHRQSSMPAKSCE